MREAPQTVYVLNDTNHGPGAYLKCSLVEGSEPGAGGELLYTLQAGGEPIKLHPSHLVPANDDDGLQEDSGCLEHMSEPALLALIVARHGRGRPDTFLGPRTLLSVRPLAKGSAAGLTAPPLPDDVFLAYAHADPASRGPHTFSIAEGLYRRLRRSTRPQALVLIGERGSGKSHQFERAARYLCRRGAGARNALEDAMLGSFTALAPVGSAPHAANANASQFGRLLQAGPRPPAAPFPASSLPLRAPPGRRCTSMQPPAP